jgi:hypothetical protein
MSELTWSIDREPSKPKKKSMVGKIIEEIPKIVSQMVVEEVLKLVGNRDWNNPANVSKTIAEMMSIDLSETIEEQTIVVFDIVRTICVPSRKDKKTPIWICQSVIRVDPKHRYIDYNGQKYNKLDIILESEYFKNQMDKVANYSKCSWEIRTNNPGFSKELYQKTRTGYSRFNSDPESQSWLTKCASHLHESEDTEGINIKNLLMIVFKRDGE